MQRVFLVGRLRACPHRRRGLLTVPLELGSRESVKLHQSKKSPMGSLYFGYLIGYDLCFSEVLEGCAVDEIGL